MLHMDIGDRYGHYASKITNQLQKSEVLVHATTLITFVSIKWKKLARSDGAHLQSQHVGG